jgi:hypothetical protein
MKLCTEGVSTWAENMNSKEAKRLEREREEKELTAVLKGNSYYFCAVLEHRYTLLLG